MAFLFMVLLLTTNFALISVSSIQTEVILQWDVVRIVTLPVNGSVTVRVDAGWSGIAYGLCQAHTQTGRITLSSEPHIQHSTGKTGRDVGVIITPSSPSGITWYLFSNSSKDVKVLLHAMYFSENDPLVGGCNQEFNLENDPNIALYFQPTKTTVQFQWSEYQPSDFSTCEDTKLPSYLEYHTYFKYLEADDFTEDTYFKVMSEMLTAERVSKHGTWLNKITSSGGEKSFLVVSSYRHRGVVFGIVVKQRNLTTGFLTSAAYVPTISYGCNIEDIDSCKKRDIAGVVLSTFGALVGLFLCFFGHRYFKTENFLFGFLIFALIFYQVLALETNLSYTASLVLATVFGLFGGTLLFGLWWYHGIPVLNVLIIGLVTGYIITSFLYSTPLGNLVYISTPLNYGATFACGVLLIPVLLLFFTAFLSIFSCALVGSLAFVLALDMYFQSGFHTLILNSLRHGTDSTYVTVLVATPFTDHEIALTVVWLLLVVAGVSVQFYRERKKAPFPPCPRRQRQRLTGMGSLIRTPRSSPDRQPLLGGRNHQGYGTHSHPHLQSEESDSSEEQKTDQPKMV